MRCKFIFGYLLFHSILLILNCGPIVYSPHAQNETIAPYNQKTEKHEIGGAFAANKWMIHQGSDTNYMKTYPSASFSLFYNAYFAWDKLNGIGGIELISCPASWWFPDEYGLVLLLKPSAGFQYNGNNITCRLNFSPLGFLTGYGMDDMGFSYFPSCFTWYQLTFLLHNQQPSKHIFWVGLRNSASAFGIIGGHEWLLNEHYVIRTEYSYLMKSPFPTVPLGKDDDIKGTVHYLTIGFFKRIK